MKKDMQTTKLRILVFKEIQDAWSAQCLEHDIAAQGETIQEALQQLALVIIGELTMRNGDLSEIGPPPDEIIDMFTNKGAKINKEPKLRNLLSDWKNRPALSISELRVA